MICDHCKGRFEPRASGRRQRFCPGGDCRKAFYSKARQAGASALRRLAAKGRPVDFEVARQSPEFQAEVAKILAGAEAQHPATLEAWGLVSPAAAVEIGAHGGQLATEETVRETPGDSSTEHYEEPRHSQTL